MKNKSFLFLLVFSLITLLFTSNVFANFDFINDNNEYSLPDLPVVPTGYSQNNFFILKDTRPVIYVMFVPAGFEGNVAYNGSKLYFLNDNNYSFKTYHLDNNQWVDDGYSYYYNGLYCNFVYSTENILNADGTIFFQKTLVPVLEQVMVQEKVEKRTIQEILGVLPLIIAVVVSFLGLRKALRILVNSLRRS